MRARATTFFVLSVFLIGTALATCSLGKFLWPASEWEQPGTLFFWCLATWAGALTVLLHFPLPKSIRDFYDFLERKGVSLVGLLIVLASGFVTGALAALALAAVFRAALVLIASLGIASLGSGVVAWVGGMLAWVTTFYLSLRLIVFMGNKKAAD